jgi:hypothetical protein
VVYLTNAGHEDAVHPYPLLPTVRTYGATGIPNVALPPSAPVDLIHRLVILIVNKRN